ncbi:MAG: toll/interleukin-1 receptor domain-containing protein [Alphaproteobacteria bacterium]
MTHQVFISYPSVNEDVVKNLAGRLREFGVAAWVYSIDKTLATDLWTEIEAKIQESEVFIFIASKFSKDAQGQHRELSLALAKIRDVKSDFRAFPVVLDDVSFGSLPDGLRATNGVQLLDAHNVKSEAFYIAKTFFPDIVAAQKLQGWNYPRSGQWLEVCQIDRWVEEYFDLGDRVYFRRISPLGLFECYSPKLGELFWFASHNLRISDVIDEDGSLEREKVPRRYLYDTSIECEWIGLQQLVKEGRLT